MSEKINIKLGYGAGSPVSGQACWMTAIYAYDRLKDGKEFAEGWSDMPSCVDPGIRDVCVNINDSCANDEARLELIGDFETFTAPIGTASNDLEHHLKMAKAALLFLADQCRTEGTLAPVKEWADKYADTEPTIEQFTELRESLRGYSVLKDALQRLEGMHPLAMGEGLSSELIRAVFRRLKSGYPSSAAHPVQVNLVKAVCASVEKPPIETEAWHCTVTNLSGDK